MHIKATAAVVVLALTPEIAGHGIFYNIIGDADPSIRSYVLGIHTSTPRDGTGQLPFQRDIVVLKNPIVPPTKWSKWWKKPRTYWANGCGANIWDQNDYYSTWSKTKSQYAKANANQKNYWYYQMPVKKMIDWKGLTTTYAKTNRIIKVSPGGWIRIMHHQVNADGAGPFKCKISSNGAPSGWNSGWIVPSGANNVPGSAKAFSFRGAGTLQQFAMTINVPKNLKCSGSYGGMNNICMMRCENYAKNGPFGGCVPFQLVVKTTPPPAPPVAPVDNIGDTPEADEYVLSDDEVAAVDSETPSVEDDNADPAIDPAVDPDAEANKVKRDADGEEKVKRDADDDALAIAFGGEDVPDAVKAASKKQMKAIPAAQKAKLNAKLQKGQASNKANAGKTGNNKK
ncbi:hypothetical protein H072_3969 [Dactylellina haptotyla CBS 200.50]|uniref:Uncharacterized protein n=1 Tax=Dactylellina haptotyla (strain CBS 200.50) TaxID=1284197 RepID=S8ALU4_DACHA|nr:hypothetical protein H072_3969 [Dactylellina haptotyla CBS 200.50]